MERFLKKGSSRGDILRLALAIIDKAKHLNLEIVPVWTRRMDPRLLKADAGSKGVDTDTWELPQDVFDELNSCFGPFSIDLFASADTAKCPRFYSRLWHENTLGVNAFAFDWTSEHALIVPPVVLALRAFKKAITTDMSGVFIIPLWEGGKFLPTMLPDGSHMMRGIVEMKLFRTKMQKTNQSHFKSILTDTFQQYIAFKFKGHTNAEWVSEVCKTNCVRILLGGACRICSSI